MPDGSILLQETRVPASCFVLVVGRQVGLLPAGFCEPPSGAAGIRRGVGAPSVSGALDPRLPALRMMLGMSLRVKAWAI